MSEISIHAPREGRDGVIVKSDPSKFTFQSTRPARGATLAGEPVTYARAVFQSTRPARGATSKEVAA